MARLFYTYMPFSIAYFTTNVRNSTLERTPQPADIHQGWCGFDFRFRWEVCCSMRIGLVGFPWDMFPGLGIQQHGVASVMPDEEIAEL